MKTLLPGENRAMQRRDGMFSDSVEHSHSIFFYITKEKVISKENASPERLDPTHPPTHPQGTVNQILPAEQIGSQSFKHYEVPGLGLNTDTFFVLGTWPLKNTLGSFWKGYGYR